MKGTVLGIGLILSGIGTSWAQRLERPHWATDEAQVGVQASAAFASRDVQNEFVGTLLWQDEMDAEVKGRQLDQLIGRPGGSRFGGDYASNVSAYLPFRNAPFGLSINVGDRYHLSGDLSDDAAKLALLGNAPFAGDTLFAGGSRLFSMRYQKVGLGFTYEQSPHATFSVMLSYLHGGALLDAQVERANVFTSAFGDTLSADLRGSFRNTVGGSSWMPLSGAGVGVDAWAHREVPVSDGVWHVDVGVIDVGWIQWFGEGTMLTADTLLEWTGLTINNETTAESIAAMSLQDSILGEMAAYQTTRISDVYLPGWAQASVGYMPDRGLGGSLGMAVRWNSVARPYGWLQAHYRLSGQALIGAEWGYGGMAANQLSVMGQFGWGAFDSQLRVGNLEALLLPKRLGGATLALNITYRFNR